MSARLTSSDDSKSIIISSLSLDPKPDNPECLGVYSLKTLGSFADGFDSFDFKEDYLDFDRSDCTGAREECLDSVSGSCATFPSEYSLLSLSSLSSLPAH